MDNRVISIKSEGRKDFDLAFQLLLNEGRATHYCEHKDKGLILLWHETERLELDGFKIMKLPFKMDWKAAANMVWGWLQEQSADTYQDYIDDYDVDMHKGFVIYNEEWGHVAGSAYAILAVLPMWAWYGK